MGNPQGHVPRKRTEVVELYEGDRARSSKPLPDGNTSFVKYGEKRLFPAERRGCRVVNPYVVFPTVDGRDEPKLCKMGEAMNRRI
jgi:hypothetical protein